MPNWKFRQKSAVKITPALKIILILLFIFSAAFAVSPSLVSAHGGMNDGDEDEENAFDFSSPIFYIELTAILIIIASIILFCAKEFSSRHKKILFWLIAMPVALSTLYLSGNTVYNNLRSETNGPVHWHADYQIWACGEKLNLKDPHGMANRMGTGMLHEHNDDRIHIEGVLDKVADASLGNFFKAIGGFLEHDEIAYNTNKGNIEYHNEDICPDGTKGTLKVYVNGKKIEEPEDYVISPEENVPPGDCIIIVFDNSDSETTDKICDSLMAKGWDYESYSKIGGQNRKYSRGER